MKTKIAMSFALLVVALAAAGAVFAHHGSVAYDNSKLVEVKQGLVTKVQWANPHILVMFDAKSDKGNVVHWIVEGDSVHAVNASGWTQNSVKAGDMITAYLYQVKNGNPVGRLGKIVLASGRVLGSGDLAGDRPAQCDKDFGPGGDEASACRPDGKKTTNKE
jgi:hypothetical protein